MTSTTALPVSFRGVGRAFGTARVLRDVDLDVAAGEIVAILGPSGCGKSTLLRSVSGLDAPSEGAVSIAGTAVGPVDQRCAVAFQEPRLLPWRSVEANVALGLPHGTAKEPGRRRVAELLELTGLADAARRRPREISGGMAQRASLARALAREPGVLVLDEPFGALDALTRLRMQDLLLDVHAAVPTTVILVTHDVDEALVLADHVVLLGTDGDLPGATVRRVVRVPGARPRDRGAPELVDLRAELLAGLGVPAHHTAPSTAQLSHQETA
ncbi:ABC transporter ATP-binding protein [Herbiconiux sp. SYSU D00978]|uniref:ABC transporter ATP-binding protein n=1 Tax=Herbiconiux sp. SYSU D00978 TaxID=2812562 RepID=UPI0027DC63DF|nr:ABC transporter ATP-binding protein [Herbiconiux sp. SYSU D00978]